MRGITYGSELVYDTEETTTPDYVAGRLLRELEDRLDHLQFLNDYLVGAPFDVDYEEGKGLPTDLLVRLREISKLNLAGLIVSATADRLGIEGFRTGAGKDESGDAEAMRYFKRDEMNIKATYGMQLACGYRSAYLFVDPVAKRQTIVPPTNAAVINDMYGEPVAGLLLQRDRNVNRDVLKLFVRDRNEITGEATGPVHMFVATREFNETEWADIDGLKVTHYDSEVPLTSGMEHDWVWWKKEPVTLDRVPITSLVNKDGLSEFEQHVPLIDRIHYTIFQRMLVIAINTLKQRVVIPDKDKPLPQYDEFGNEIDYDSLFDAAPGSLWIGSPGMSVWESSALDVNGILEAAKSDLKDLANQSYTNMSYFSDSVNLSAAGANNQQDNYISKIEDRRRRFESRLCRHMSIFFEVIGDQARSDVSQIEVIWPSAKVESLTDRAATFASLRANGVALETAFREGMKFTPDEIRRAMSELLEEKLGDVIDASIGALSGSGSMAGGNGRDATALASSQSNQAVT